MSIHSPWCLWRRAIFWGIFPISAPHLVNTGRTADAAEHQQMGEGGQECEGKTTWEGWMGKDEEMIQGSNKFRDKRGEDRVNGQSKATDEVESECEGQQRRVRQQEMRQRKRRVDWWWKQKNEQIWAQLRGFFLQKRKKPYTYLISLVQHTWPLNQISKCLSFNMYFCPCIILHLNWNQVEARTLEMAPEGAVLLELSDVSSRSLRARWTAPPRPNGNLVYTLNYKSKGSNEHLLSQWHGMFDVLSLSDPQ